MPVYKVFREIKTYRLPPPVPVVLDLFLRSSKVPKLVELLLPHQLPPLVQRVALLVQKDGGTETQPAPVPHADVLEPGLLLVPKEEGPFPDPHTTSAPLEGIPEVLPGRLCKGQSETIKTVTESHLVDEPVVLRRYVLSVKKCLQVPRTCVCSVYSVISLLQRSTGDDNHPTVPNSTVPKISCSRLPLFPTDVLGDVSTSVFLNRLLRSYRRLERSDP